MFVFLTSKAIFQGCLRAFSKELSNQVWTFTAGRSCVFLRLICIFFPTDFSQIKLFIPQIFSEFSKSLWKASLTLIGHTWLDMKARGRKNQQKQHCRFALRNLYLPYSCGFHSALKHNSAWKKDEVCQKVLLLLNKI